MEEIQRIKSNLQSIPQNRLLVILFLFVAIFHFATLERYPPPFVDEGWLASRAWAFRSTHQPVGALDLGVFDHLPGYATYFALIPTSLQSLTYIGQKYPELLPLRVLSLAFGLLLLGALYFIVRHLTDKKTALLAIVLISFSRAFFYSAHLARTDIMAAALGFTGIALALCADPKQYWAHFAAGLLMVAAFEVHPYGSMYAPIPILLYIVRGGWRTFKARKFWTFILGGFAGAAAYALLHIARYPETWIQINTMIASKTRTPPIFSGSLLVLYQSLLGSARLAYHLAPFLVPVAAVAIIYLAYQRGMENRLLLALLMACVILSALIIRNKFTYYGILYVPVIEIAAAYLFFRTQPLLLRFCMGILLIAALIYGGFALTNNHAKDFDLVKAELSRSVRPGELVMGNQLWWLALPDRPWYSWENLYYFRRWKKEASLQEAFLEFQPKILIIDAQLAFFIRQNTSGNSYFDELSLPEKDFDAILQKYAKLRREFDGGYYGKIQIVEFHWDSMK